MVTGRQVLVETFSRLYAKAATKLSVPYAAEDMANAQLEFEQRFASVLDAVDALQIDAMPAETMAEMEEALDKLTPADIAAQLAAIPVTHQAQEMLRLLSYRAAEQKLIEYSLRNADNTYGGN